MKELDETDKKILMKLQENARISYSKIAKELNLSESTIHHRIRRLKEIGIIKGFRTLLDPDKIGLHVSAFVLLKTDPHHHSEALEKITRIKGVYEVYDVTGEYSGLVKVMVRSREELAEVLDEIGKIDGVLHTYTLVVLKVISQKETIELD
ncbi:AsnC family transcriptional regulator [Ignicoccus islandicus DSM 13165]|uniref:AsnC family transcriptional regulator n=1 Tax=Ignicoccus islandicus DSM 13165 TaxID=940295 RepID=A0A0U3DX28_9CREN|nr:Lrp/AsnC family transcriptional regulator [Ignicoccus islandicus]ALU12058.1 AsnC family transcriptional regulator [Ignicoccus islandicus DSM 13165]